MNMKTKLITLVTLISCVTGFAQSTLQRVPLTSSALARQLLTNENILEWQTTLGVNTNAESGGGGTNGINFGAIANNHLVGASNSQPIDITIGSGLTLSGRTLVGTGGTGAVVNAHQVLAGPVSGSGASTYRTLDASDIPNLNGTALFVATNGVDSNTGASNSPLATINAAITKLGGVGTVVVLPGYYTNNNYIDGSLATNITVIGVGRPSFVFGQRIDPSAWTPAAGTTNVYIATVDTNLFWVPPVPTAVAMGARQGADKYKPSFIHEWGTKEAAITSAERNPIQGNKDYRLDNYRLKFIPVRETSWANHWNIENPPTQLTMWFRFNHGLSAGDQVTLGNTGQSFYSNTFTVLSQSNYVGYTTVTVDLVSNPGFGPSSGVLMDCLGNLKYCDNGSWCLTNTTLFMRTSDGGSPVSYVYLPSTATNVSFVKNCKPYTTLRLINLNEYFAYEGLDGTSCGYLEARNCSFIGNNDEGVFSYDMGQGPLYLYAVESAANNNDGMGYHTHQINCLESQTAYESECWVHDNADEGTSGHYGSHISTTGGLYEHNASAGITPYASTLATCLGTVIRYNDVGVGIGGPNAFNSPASCANTPAWTTHLDFAYLTGCSIYGNRIGVYGDPSAPGNKIELVDCYLDNNLGPNGDAGYNVLLTPNVTLESGVIRNCTFVGPVTVSPYLVPEQYGTVINTLGRTNGDIGAQFLSVRTNSYPKDWPATPDTWGEVRIVWSNLVAFALYSTNAAGFPTNIWTSTNVFLTTGGAGNGFPLTADGDGASHKIFGLSELDVTGAGPGAITIDGDNDIIDQTHGSDGLHSTNGTLVISKQFSAAGITNTGLAAQRTVLITDANGKVISLANGGNNTVLHGTTPPTETAVVEADLGLTDVTTANASTSQHGLLKKLDNNSAHFMDGTGNWSTPAGGGGIALRNMAGGYVATGLFSQSTARYVSPFGATLSSTEANVSTAVTACTLTNLYITSYALGVNTNMSVTVMTNGVASSIVATIANGSAAVQIGTDTTHGVPVPDQCLISLKFSGNNTSNDATAFSWILQGY